MAKLTTAVEANYDGTTNTLTTTLMDADGQAVTLQFDGLAWAHLMGMATIEHQVFQQTDLRKPAPWIVATGIQTGMVSNQQGQHLFGVTLLIPKGGVMNFLLPPELETALRDKLKTPEVKH